MKKLGITALAALFLSSVSGLALAQVTTPQGVTPKQSISQTGKDKKKGHGHGCHGKCDKKGKTSGN
ncbi:MAG TPA: hypothetical protein VEK06_03990 [Myxococcota bacterium]|nr:hypothetical protein [Myxococcota bacterium]